jgi:hypothetical protein
LDIPSAKSALDRVSGTANDGARASKVAGDTTYIVLHGCQHAWEVEHARINKCSVCEDGILE